MFSAGGIAVGPLGVQDCSHCRTRKSLHGDGRVLAIIGGSLSRAQARAVSNWLLKRKGSCGVTQAAPATNFEPLKKRITDAIAIAPSEFELRQLRSEATKLANADPMGSVELRAMLACIEGDVDEADRLYRGVFGATGNSVERVFRYLMLLAQAGYSARAGAVYREFLTLSELAPQAHERLAKVLGFCGWAAESTMIRQQLVQTGYELENKIFEDISFVASEQEGDDRLPSSITLGALLTDARALSAIGVEDAWVADRVGDAIQFFRSRSTGVMAVRSTAIPHDDGHVGLLVNFYVDQTSEDAAEAEWDLHGFMAERSPDLVDVEDVAFAAIGVQVKESHAN